MRKLLLLLMVLFTSAGVNAQATDTDTTFNIGEWRVNLLTTEAPYTLEIDGFALVSDFDPNPATPADPDNIVIPETLVDSFDGTEYTVVAIGANAFDGNGTLKTVVLPATVISLKNRAFHKCYALTTINLENVERLDDLNVFARDNNLAEVDLSSCTYVSQYSFYNHAALKSVDLPVIETLRGNAFQLSGITQITLGSSLTAIEQDSHFKGCGNLGAIKLAWTSAASVVAIDAVAMGLDTATVTVYVPVGSSAEYANSGWDAMTIVEGEIPSIGIGTAFTVADIEYGITSLDPLTVQVLGTTLTGAITIPATVENPDDATYNVTAIGANAFYQNSELTAVTLPASVKIINEAAFMECATLTTINTENVTTFRKNSFRSSAITSLDLSEAVTLDSNALGRMYNLTGVVNLPKVETIGTYAFVFNQGVTEIHLGSSLTSVAEELVFFGLPALKLVKIDTETPPATTLAFNFGYNSDRGTDNDSTGLVDGSLITLQVPNDAAVTAYGAALGWQDFGPINTDGVLSFDDILSGNLDIQVSADTVTVNSSSTFTNGNITIYDITGRVLTSNVLNGASASVNISNLASGIYIVKVTEGNAKLVKRFAKQ